MESKSTKIMLGIIICLLALSTFMQIGEGLRHLGDSRRAAVFEAERVKIIKDCMVDMETADTKTIYQQIYFVSRAQLRMQNMISQQLQTISGE